MAETTSGEAPAPAAANDAAPLLELRGLSKNFGAVQALIDVDFAVRPGEVTALIGDNGAGKSVTIKTISGIHGPDSGQIYWEGRPVRIRTPREAAALGIETVFQDLALCNNLDIVQNLFLGRVVAVRPAADLDRQIAVDLMTTGQSSRLTPNGQAAKEPDRT